MRKGLMVGACVVGWVGASATGFAQFAADRGTPPVAPRTPPATAPGLPSGFQPVGGTTPANPQAAPFLNPTGAAPRPRAGEVVPSSIREGVQHPWEVKAENGAWMICVKAYVGPDSMALAEKMAKFIREEHRLAAFLYERNAEERRAELATINAIRESERAKLQPLIDRIAQERKEAQAAGREFIEPEVKFKLPKPYHESPEQWAVLVGGFKDMDSARAGLTKLKTLAPPDGDKSGLLDRVEKGGLDKDNKEQVASNFINPFKTAFVVPNPTVAQEKLADKGKLEPFVVSLNEGRPNNLLAAKKPWTLLVRSFRTPGRVVNKDADGASVFDKLKGMGGPNLLDVTAEEAERLAVALRHPNMKPQPLDAFVLHHRTGSIVTVGEFDTPDAPELKALQTQLLGMTFNKLGPDQKPVIGRDGRPEVERMFDSVAPFPVPVK